MKKCNMTDEKMIANLAAVLVAMATRLSFHDVARQLNEDVFEWITTREMKR